MYRIDPLCGTPEPRTVFDRPTRGQVAGMTTTHWTPMIIMHASAATAALGLGALILGRRKGTRSHRILGWIWAGLMALVAISSFWIYQNEWSWIHGLSIGTLVGLITGIQHARARRVTAHRRAMVLLFVCALVVAGLFTLLPGRLIGRALWGHERHSATGPALFNQADRRTVSPSL